jgi:hypothetical protein
LNRVEAFFICDVVHEDETHCAVEKEKYGCN